MERKIALPKKNVSICCPLFFWKKCCICKNKFKKEKGYKFLVKSITEYVIDSHYICSRCAQTKEKAENLAMEFVFENYQSDYYKTGVI